MSEAPATTYDELPYGDYVFAYTHPANLATVAALYGLRPPPVERCRVLELGCAAGANLMPMALGLPGSEFVGLDLSPRQIARGREVAGQLGLTNLTLQTRNILEPTADLGTFDYVLCHGVYSWVPPPVQDRILDICRTQLSPDGVAYVSYNVYPGWHLRGMVRDMLGFHVAAAGDPAERTAQARAFLDFLLEALPDLKTAYGMIFQKEVEMLRPAADSYLFHEHLEADNRPVYFHEFAAHAAEHGLQYVSEASPVPLPGNLKPGILQKLAELAGDRLRLEQYLDFIRGRTFRRSVLCHAGAKPDPAGAAARLPAFAVSTRFRPVADDPDPDPAGREEFVTASEVRFSTTKPALKGALRRLADASPEAVPFAELLADGRARDPVNGRVAEQLADDLLQLYLIDVVGLHLRPPALAREAGPRPCASPLARLQAARGDAVIHDLRHRSTDPDPFARHLLPLLDGTRDRAALIETLTAQVRAGEFVVSGADGQPVTDPAVQRDVLIHWTAQALHRLAHAALLTA
jgi:methyltransferase-like protein